MQHYVDVEKDPADRAMGSKLLAAIHKLQADQQKEIDDAVGVGPGLKLAQRMAGGGR